LATVIESRKGDRRPVSRSAAHVREQTRDGRH
jgi:hypothetical protein